MDCILPIFESLPIIGFPLSLKCKFTLLWQCQSFVLSVNHNGPEIGIICIGLNGCQRMNLNDFGDTQTLPLTPACGSHLLNMKTL